MSIPDVSVVMPIFNRAEVAERAVRSVLDQEGVSFELIVVDDCSDKPHARLYQEVTERGHTVLVQSRNQGPGAARNRGAKLARAPWTAFLDSDDHWLPDKLQHHLESLSKSGLRIGQTDEIWYRNGERVNPPKAHKITGGDLFRRSLRAVCVSSSTVMLRTDLFHEFGGFDESLFVCEDYDLWLKVAAKERFDYCLQPLVVKYGGHDDQLSRALPAMDRFRILSILGLLKTDLLESEEHRHLAEREVQRKLRILAKGSAKRGKVRVVKLCQAISQLATKGAWEEALVRSETLLSQWAVRPHLADV